MFTNCSGALTLLTFIFGNDTETNMQQQLHLLGGVSLVAAICVADCSGHFTGPENKAVHLIYAESLGPLWVNPEALRQNRISFGSSLLLG